MIWTTNYDDLIEKAFDNVQKIVDVKSRNEHLSNTLANRECILYKMHGDKNNPNDAILIKDDYERYYKAHKQFLSALTGDLISKTFLFVGFSFQDPNLDYILSRIRVDYEENPRQHYAIMKSIDRKDYESDADYDYAKRRNDLFLEDLKRYRISALVIDDFSEITEILQEIERRLNQNNIFISGSAEEYGVFLEENEGAREMPLYVLTNAIRLNGASVLFYTDCLKSFADSVGRDIFVLPSSIHEVLLIPVDEDVSAWDMRQVVETVNHQIVSDEEILSNHVYRYLYDSHKLIIAA